jgi:SAM-dependent methyltransferase
MADRALDTPSRIKATARRCPVCEYDRGVLIHSQRFAVPDGEGEFDAYDVVCCQRCGVGFADTPVPQSQYDRVYANLSRYAAGPAAHVVESERDLHRFQEVAAAIDAVVSDRTARIVDIGCANGLLLRALRDRGYRNVCGVDPSPACVAHAARIPGVDAFVGSLSAIPAAAGPIDVVVLSHVLEHVRDVRRALTDLNGCLARNASVYVEVPDAARYVEFAWSPFQDFNTEHINHFSETALRNLLRQCGFTPYRTGTKTILSAPGMLYPALFCFGVIDDDREALIQKDEELEQRLRAYVRVSTQLMRDIDARLQHALAGAPAVIVWGTGELTAKLLVDTALGSAKIVAFVDSNPINQGRTLHGCEIVAPDTLQSGTEPIVVASILHAPGITRAVRDRGLANPVVTLTPAADAVPRLASR